MGEEGSVSEPPQQFIPYAPWIHFFVFVLGRVLLGFPWASLPGGQAEGERTGMNCTVTLTGLGATANIIIVSLLPDLFYCQCGQCFIVTFFLKIKWSLLL